MNTIADELFFRTLDKCRTPVTALDIFRRTKVDLTLRQWESMNSELTEFYKKSQAQKTQKTYTYLITFTISDPTPEKIQQCKEWIVDRKNCDYFKEMYISLEHEDTNAHYHVVIVTIKPIEKTRFKYYTVKFNSFIDFKRVTKGTEQDTIDYIRKDSEPEHIVGF